MWFLGILDVLIACNCGKVFDVILERIDCWELKLMITLYITWFVNGDDEQSDGVDLPFSFFVRNIFISQMIYVEWVASPPTQNQ
jgi:hypothetical protein